MKQLVVHAERQMVEAAVLQDGRLVDYDAERTADRQGAGNIYKGRVVNVLPGMQAAFVDIGQGKNAFLYIDDVLDPHLEKQPVEKPSISQLLQKGQELIVQVTKEPLNGKGARVTTHFTLPGRWLVYMPNADYVGVSKKIASEQERSRLRTAGEELRRPGDGLILRTAAEGESIDALRADLTFLQELWDGIASRAQEAPCPSELHREAGLTTRLVRDYLDADTDEIWVDDEAAGEEIARLVRKMAPQLADRIKAYAGGSGGLFDHFGVSRQLDKAFARRILLPNGGDLVWDQTEALTVVDVNTGRFTGTSSLEDTVYRTNLEAAEEIARLLRLRDAGGIIIVDFIDMESEAHKMEVLGRLEQLARHDRTKCHVVGWTRLGLVEITRKKARENAAARRYEACAACRGSGRIIAGPADITR